MKKTLLTLTLALTSFLGFSQFTYHSVDDCLVLTTSNDNNTASNTVSIVNPSTIINPSTNVSQLIGSGNNARVEYLLPTNLSSNDTFIFSIDTYTYATGATADGRMIVRLYNASVGSGAGNREDITVESYINGWQTIGFNGAIATTSAAVGAAGGYDTMRLIYNSQMIDNTTPVFYDNIKFNTDNTFAPINDTPTLVGGNGWIYDNGTGNLNATLLQVNTSVLTPSETSPNTVGNASANVLKVERGTASTEGVNFIVNDFDYLQATNISFRIYPVCDTDSSPKVQVKLRKQGQSSGQTQLNSPTFNLVSNQWNEITIDFSGVSPNGMLPPGGLYDTILLNLNQTEEATTAGNIYYVDAVQAPQQALSVNDNALISTSVYPNPVTNSFQIDSNRSIESVTLYNITGGLVKTFGEVSNYNISDLSTGIYLAKVKTEVGSKTLRIIKE